MKLESLDLNLLLVFDALAKEQHVTRAAAKIGLSQPALSTPLPACAPSSAIHFSSAQVERWNAAFGPLSRQVQRRLPD